MQRTGTENFEENKKEINSSVTYIDLDAPYKKENGWGAASSIDLWGNDQSTTQNGFKNQDQAIY